MTALRPCATGRAAVSSLQHAAWHAAVPADCRAHCISQQVQQQMHPRSTLNAAAKGSLPCNRIHMGRCGSRPARWLAVVASSSNGASLPGTATQTRQQQQQQEQGQEHPLPPYAAWPATAKVALRTGAYITVLGLAIFFLPASLFGAVFDASRVALGWVRVGGVLASLFGAYYLGAALDDAAGRPPLFFYQTTIVGRLALSAAFTYLVATRQCEAGLLVLAAANAASSLLLRHALLQRQP